MIAMPLSIRTFTKTHLKSTYKGLLINSSNLERPEPELPMMNVNPLSTNHTKWPSILKQFFRSTYGNLDFKKRLVLPEKGFL